jgi:hypothetical protein
LLLLLLLLLVVVVVVVVVVSFWYFLLSFSLSLLGTICSADCSDILRFLLFWESPTLVVDFAFFFETPDKRILKFETT